MGSDVFSYQAGQGLRDQVGIVIRPVRVVLWLGAVALLLIVIHLLVHYAALSEGEVVKRWTLAYRFNVNGENTVPAYFSSLLLLAVAVLTAILAKEQGRERFFWLGLALLFAALSIDEASSFHELLIVPVRHHLGVGGWLHFAWVVPAFGLLAVFAVVYLRFWGRLPARTRVLFALAGVLYVGGAVGLEIVGGYFASQGGEGTWPFILSATIEEGSEMAGVIVFVYALLDFKARRGGSVRFDVRT